MRKGALSLHVYLSKMKEEKPYENMEAQRLGQLNAEHDPGSRSQRLWR
ncbi:hypothetical protein KSC_096780 [Ktedonobacter sp. SOSP1-52]|nr:hypothetical protein KSC_096780 [Ktedonobacter sp. SOSP1-52]